MTVSKSARTLKSSVIIGVALVEDLVDLGGADEDHFYGERHGLRFEPPHR